MKTRNQRMRLGMSAVAVFAILVTPIVGAAQEAEVSANIGWVSK